MAAAGAALSTRSPGPPSPTGPTGASTRPVVGLVPAGGRATRVAPLPLSKELYPIGFRDLEGSPRPVVACEGLLRAMAAAGAGAVYVVLGDGKWDIPAYLGDGAQLGLDLAYLTISRSPGVPHSADRAHAHVRDATVLFGFPDIVFTDHDALLRLRRRLVSTGADAVLGLLSAERPENADLVDAVEGRVRRIRVKPAGATAGLAWMLAAWGPRFTAHLHEQVARLDPELPDGPELHMGHVLQSAVDAGLRVGAEQLRGGFTDIGTPEGLYRAVRGGG